MARPARPARPDSSRGNLRLAAVLAAVVFGMVGLAFAAVPLYRVFCQVTGYGGTTQVADVAPDQVLDRTMTIRFEGFVNRDLPWRFQPEQRSVTVKVGEPALVFFKAENLSDQPTAGVATFNVTPLKVGQYFNKVQCFCFSEQVLQPGETVDMGVSFFVDPAIADDRNADEVGTITLSYTFFPDAEALPEEPEGGKDGPTGSLEGGTPEDGALRGSSEEPERGKQQTAALPR